MSRGDAELRKLERLVQADPGNLDLVKQLEAVKRRLGILLPWENPDYVGSYNIEFGHRLRHGISSLRRMAEVRMFFGFGYGTSARSHLMVDCFQNGRIPTGILILRPLGDDSRAFFGHMQYPNNDYIVIVFSEFHGQNEDATSKHFGRKWVDYGMNLSIQGSTETLTDRYFDISIEWVAQFALEHDIPLKTGTIRVGHPERTYPEFNIKLDD